MRVRCWKCGCTFILPVPGISVNSTSVSVERKEFSCPRCGTHGWVNVTVERKIMTAAAGG
jgi:Zn finger protein HypA/HybF involved in hydrogenase expression